MCSRPSSLFNGFLVVNKPLGVRSTSCVSAVGKILGKGTKIGHGGTLDSTARGVLVLLLGKATRLCQYVMDLPKTYDGTVMFGKRTSSDDEDGEVLETAQVPPISKSLIDGLIPSFLGTRLQRPPVISALKVCGERAHKIARRGGAVNLKARPVTITSIEVRRCSSPEVDLRVLCRKGTYIRSLARDLGDLLGCGAYLKSLTRMSVGPFSLEDSVSLAPGSEVERETLIKAIKPLNSLFGSYTCYGASGETVQRIKNGLAVPLSELCLKKRGVFRSASPVMVEGDGLLSFCDYSISGGECHLIPVTNIHIHGDDIP